MSRASPGPGRVRRRGRMPAGGAFGVGLALLAVSALAHAEGESALHRLAERLVGVWGAPGEMRVELVVADLPRGLPVELPLPGSFELLGSLARFERGALASLQVVLDGPERTADAFETVRGAFDAAGWSVFSDGGIVGFVPTQSSLFARACAPEWSEGRRPVAFLNVSWVPGGASDVRVDLTLDAWEGACTQESVHGMGPTAPLPTLSAPTGAEVSSPLVMFGVDEAAAIAVLRGADTRMAVEHYEAELASRGWSRLPGGVTDDYGTRSRWALGGPGERPWVGVFAADWPRPAGPVTVSFTIVAEEGP